MPTPPPVPSSGAVPPPPLFNFPWVIEGTWNMTVPAVSMMTTFWAFLIGNAGLVDQVAIIQNMHGDGTLSPTGVLLVTKTNGTPFGYFATGTDAANLSGFLSASRLAINSIPWNRLLYAPGPMLLGANAAGPLFNILLGRGFSFAGGVLVYGDPVTVVGSLGTPTAGLRAFVTDSTVAASGNFGAIVAGGGAFTVPTFADGVNWLLG